MQIHHIALDESWVAAQHANTYTESTLGRDLRDVGFIHCSRPEQLDEVFRHFYTGVKASLVLLVIETDLLTSPWQFDEVPGESSSFPHIYGPLNIDAVISAEPLKSSATS